MKAIRIFQRSLSLFLVFVMVGSALSCYSRRQMPTARLNKVDIEQLEFFALDPSAPDLNVWVLSNVKIEAAGLSARFDRASKPLIREIATIHRNADKRRNQNRVLVYVHPATVKTYGDTLTARLAYTDISKIEVFEPDAGKTIGLALGIVGGLAAVGFVAVLIACACPHVYAETNDGRQLEGEMFGGAAYPQLERHDWLPLPHLQTVDNQYKIHLSNQEHQNQHTNFLALEVLDAAPGVRPLFDKYGQLQTIAAPQAPVTATDVSGQNVLAEVLAEDEKIYRGDPENDRPDATDRLTLSFAKPIGALHAKLMLNAKNNPWMDYIYYQFQDALGQYADNVRQRYRAKSAAANNAWLERQKIPLAVWLETTPGRWEKADFFNLVGGSAFKNDVLPLDLSRVQGDSVRVRLEFGFRFWEIDYAALDFSENQPVQRQTLSPVSAISQTGENVLPALAANDDQYYDQPNLGDEATIAFEAPPLAPGQVRSFILHGRGHYEIFHAPAPGRPNIFQLRAWDKENALPRLSRARWREANRLTLHQ